MKNTKPAPIWLQKLWKIWYVLIAIILFIARFAFLNRADEDARFFVFAAYLLIAWLPLMFINMYQGLKLDVYLRKHHQAQRQIWGGFGPLGAIRKLSFLQQKFALIGQISGYRHGIMGLSRRRLHGAAGCQRCVHIPG